MHKIKDLYSGVAFGHRKKISTFFMCYCLPKTCKIFGTCIVKKQGKVKPPNPLYNLIERLIKKHSNIDSNCEKTIISAAP